MLIGIRERLKSNISIVLYKSSICELKIRGIGKITRRRLVIILAIAIVIS